MENAKHSWVRVSLSARFFGFVACAGTVNESGLPLRQCSLLGPSVRHPLRVLDIVTKQTARRRHCKSSQVNVADHSWRRRQRRASATKTPTHPTVNRAPPLDRHLTIRTHLNHGLYRKEFWQCHVAALRTAETHRASDTIDRGRQGSSSRSSRRRRRRAYGVRV